MRCRKATGKISSFNKEPRSRSFTACLAAGVLGSLISPGVYAGSNDGDAAGSTVPIAAPIAAPSDIQELAPVDVTGKKSSGFAPVTVETGPYRGLDALDVPATVNVITREVMDAQGDTGIYDALRNVAGVTRQQLSGLAYDNISIRGIPLDNRSSFLFNGVLPIDNNIWMPLEDKQRVEVLKSASALYYGFTVPAGVVNMVSKRAGTDPVTSVSVLGDSDGSYGTHVDVSRRFGPDGQFGIRVNAMDEHVETPVDGDHGYRKFASVALDWRVNSQLSLKYDFEHIETSIVEQAGLVPLAPVNGVIALPAIPNPSKLLVSANNPTQASANTQLLQANYALTENWTATFSVGQSITRRDRFAWVFQNYNVATGAGTLQASQQTGQMYENKIVRVDVNGAFKTGSINHAVTVGVSQDWIFQPNFTTNTFTASQNLYNPIVITNLIPSGTPKLFLAQHISNRGVYAYDQVDLTSRWQVMFGVRNSDYAMSQAGTPYSDITNTSPSGSITYRVAPNTSVYASFVEALESAGTAPVTAANANQVLPAVVSKQEEVGIRSRFAGNTLASLALFNLRQPSAITNSQNLFVIDGTARYHGIELSVQGDPIKNVSVIASATYLDATQVSASDPTLVGQTLENTPHVTASVFAEYRLPSVPGLSINSGIYYVGARPVNDADQAFIGSYTLISAGMRYSTRIFGRRASFQANLENAANRRYWSAAGSNQLAVGLGRTLELSSTFDF